MIVAFLDSINLFGVANIPSDSANANAYNLLGSIGTTSCYGIPLGCTSVLLIGGAVASSVLFFGAWAFGTGLWIAFYGSALAELGIMCHNMFYLPALATAAILVVIGSVFLSDLILMYTWRDTGAT